MKVTIVDVRLAFPSVFKATVPKGSTGEAAFSAAGLMGPSHPGIKLLNDAFVVLAKEKWGTKADAILKAIKAKDHLCLHDGNNKADYEGFADQWFISTRSKVRPSVFNLDKTELVEADGVIYSGCYVDMNVELWAQDNQFGKRINAQLRGIRFRRKGDAFAGGSSAAGADDFEDEIAADDPLAD